MFDLFLSPENIPFAVSIALMVVIGLMEGLSVVIGISLSGQLENLLPDDFSSIDIDAPDLDADADFDVDGAGALPSAFSRVLGWLHIGRVPILILLVLFLTFFGLSGFIIQSVIYSITGSYLPASAALVPALLIALPSLRIVGAGLARLIPKDETNAVSPDSFVGRIATIMVGTAIKGFPAEARLKDEYGQSHYIMVEPDNEDERYNVGTKVLIISRSGSSFTGISPPAEMLDE